MMNPRPQKNVDVEIKKSFFLKKMNQAQLSSLSAGASTILGSFILLHLGLWQWLGKGRNYPKKEGREEQWWIHSLFNMGTVSVIVADQEGGIFKSSSTMKERRWIFLISYLCITLFISIFIANPIAFKEKDMDQVAIKAALWGTLLGVLMVGGYGTLQMYGNVKGLNWQMLLCEMAVGIFLTVMTSITATCTTHFVYHKAFPQDHLDPSSQNLFP
jgi:hypothetical protein